MKEIIQKIILLAAIIAVFSFNIAADNKSKEIIEAKAYILIEKNTGTVLDEYNSDVKTNAGYLNKLMALLLIAEDIETGKYSLDSELTAPQSVYGTKGSVVWLEPGDKMTVEELLKSVIIGNANDALTVLALHSEQSIEEFTMRMNGTAFELGLRNTAFYSPYGYYDEREYTTAHDIAVICAELADYDFLEPYFKTWRDFVKLEQVELVNENTLSRTYQRHIGFKAAHSDKSGYCIAEGGRSGNGTTFIAVVLGANDDSSSMSCAKQLINKGFSDYKVTATMFPDEMLMPVKVKDGVDFAVEICLKSQSSLVIPKGVSELNTVVVIPDFITAPIEKNEKIGTAAFYNGDTLVYETDIITKNAVKKISFGLILRNILLDIVE